VYRWHIIIQILNKKRRVFSRSEKRPSDACRIILYVHNIRDVTFEEPAQTGIYMSTVG